MTTPTGQISFLEITQEFGTPPNKNIGAFRVNQTIGDRTWPLDTGVPSSGTIRFSQLRGKTLNVVVDYPPATGGTFESNVTATTKYINGTVVGNFKSLPILTDTSQTKKVYHLIRKNIGASGSNSTAFVSGNWNNSNTLLLSFIVTGSGAIYGRGGNGGRGADLDDSGDAGQPGGHALSVSYNSTIVVESGGILAGGGGGGGGGGYQYNGGPDARGAGYGGGGGAGYPAGSGGPGGFISNGGRNGNVCQGGPGADGNLTTGGIGGPQSGGNRTNPCGLTGGGNGGYGGTGGNLGATGSNGENKSNGTGGQGGSPGDAVYHPGVTIALTNSGTVLGSY
jgi:hypothetical protein